MSSPTPVILWCHPRSVSSAFERGFMQRKDTRSYHEPLSLPFYYGKDRQCRRYDDAKCQEVAGDLWTTSLEDTLRSILESSESGDDGKIPAGKKEEEACRYIFIKDMAQYIFPSSTLKNLHPDSEVYKANQAGRLLPGPLDNPTILPIDLLRRFKHAFLMRTPKKSVPSYWKCVEEGAAGFEYFDGAEAGYAELKILYDWIANPNSTFHTAPESDAPLPGQVQAQPLPPPLVDASDLLSDPPQVIQKFCAAIGVPFDESMLSWKSGKVEAFSSWQGYHTAAENSTGFKKETPVLSEAEQAALKVQRRSSSSSDASSSSSHSADSVSEAVGDKKVSQIPQDVLDTISKNMDAYNYLYAFRTFPVSK